MTQRTTQSLAPRRLPNADQVWTVRLVFAGQVFADARRRFLKSGSTALGRDTPSGHIHIPEDAALSRKHASFEREGGTLSIRDHSRNGTFVNGQRVERADLEQGDVVRCGNSLVVVGREPLNPPDADLPGVLGVSAAMGAVRATAVAVAGTDVNVLLLGATGTGKGVVARAIHEASGRRGRWVQLNCGAVPESLAESMLFGHTRGAFTGASRDRTGYFVEADRGTLFLDEIGELAPSLQPKLLSVLDHGEVTPVGGTRPIRTDTRVIAATLADIETGAAVGAFRPDLWARLSTLVIRLPPLSERIEDMPGLLAARLPKGSPPLTADLMERLLCHDWPYNAREVHALATELVVHGAGRDVWDADLFRGPELPAAPEPPRPSHAPPDREALIRLLSAHSGVVAAVARDTGRSTKQVYRWLARFELDPADYRP